MFFGWLDRIYGIPSAFHEKAADIRKEGLDLLSRVERDVPKGDDPYEGSFPGQYVSVYVERRPRPGNYRPSFGKMAHVYHPCYIRLILPDGASLECRSDTMLDTVSLVRGDFLKRCMEL